MNEESQHEGSWTINKTYYKQFEIIFLYKLYEQYKYDIYYPG